MAEVTKTVGATGRDYSTLQGAEDDISNTTYPTAGTNVVFELHDDADFDETDGILNLTWTASNVDDVRVTVASADRHDGTANSGCRIVVAANSTVPIIRSNSDQRFVFEWLEVDGNGKQVELGLMRKQNSNHNQDYITHCLVHDNLSSAENTYGILCAGDCHVYNCIVYDIECTHSGSSDCAGIRMGNRDLTAYNNTVHNVDNDNGSGTSYGIDYADRAATDIRNNLVTTVTGTTSGTTACFDITTPSSATADYNASTDTTAGGANSLTSIVAANQYTSITGGSEDLTLKSGADAIDEGVDLGTGNNVELDIKERNRDTEGDTWDIGAHEFVGAPPAGGMTPLHSTNHHLIG